MIRQISAEAAHFPAATLLAWREAGPLRVRREVADRWMSRGSTSRSPPRSGLSCTATRPAGTS
ncbi:MAG TPA: hypothetical protein VNP03_05865 [Pseudonocardia sp.]|nr:hypothetical protein [Pseudonocardia sp.]